MLTRSTGPSLRESIDPDWVSIGTEHAVHHPCLFRVSQCPVQIVNPAFPTAWLATRLLGSRVLGSSLFMMMIDRCHPLTHCHRTASQPLRSKAPNRTQAGYRSVSLLAVHECPHPWHRILLSGSCTHQHRAQQYGAHPVVVLYA